MLDYLATFESSYGLWQNMDNCGYSVELPTTMIRYPYRINSVAVSSERVFNAHDSLEDNRELRKLSNPFDKAPVQGYVEVGNE